VIKIKQDTLFPETFETESELASIVEALEKAPTTVPPIERAVSSLLAFHETVGPTIIEEAMEVPENEINIFAPIRKSDYVEGIMKAENREEFGLPVLNFAPTRDQTAYIERVLECLNFNGEIRSAAF